MNNIEVPQEILRSYIEINATPEVQTVMVQLVLCFDCVSKPREICVGFLNTYQKNVTEMLIAKRVVKYKSNLRKVVYLIAGL